MSAVRRVIRLLGLSVCLASVGGLVVTAVMLADRHPELSLGGGGVTASAIQVGAVLALTAAGLSQVVNAGTRRLGVLFVVAAVSMTAGTAPAPSIRWSWLFTAALVLAAATPLLLGSAGLLWYGDRRWARRAVVIALVPIGLSGIFPALLFDPAAAGCHDCPANLLQVWSATDSYQAVVRMGLVATLAWEAGAVGLIVVMLRRLPRIAQPVSSPVMVGAAGICAVAAISAAHTLSLPTVEVDRPVQLAWLVQCCLALVMAGGVAARPGMNRRLSRRLARQVTSVFPDREGLRQTFADVVGDPELRLVFPSQTKLRPAGAGAGWLRVARGDVPVVELHYSPTVQPAADRLVTAVRSAGPALEFAAARESLAAEEAELQHSRQRIVQRGDEARRRIERNLHDGAQQRLIALSMMAGRARRQAVTPPEVAVFSAAQHEILKALDEVRTIARGLFPAALSDDGLPAALRELQDHSPVPLRIDHIDVTDLPLPTAMATYRLIADTVQYLGADPRPGSLLVALGSRAGHLHLRLILPRGPGGDLDSGSWLRHAQDRVDALSGSVSICPEGDQLLVEAVIPCE
jgi:signal transduction histidine kinase